MANLTSSDKAGGNAGTGHRGGPARSRFSRPTDVVIAIAAPVICLALGSLSGLATRDAVADWYPSLIRPWFTPPAAAFPIAWTLLYTLMGIAIWRLVRLVPGGVTEKRRRQAIGFFVAQFALNLAWSPAFFGLQSPAMGVVVIVPMLALIGLTIRSAWGVDRMAGMLLLPYFAWVAYATALTTTIFFLN